MPSWLRLPLFTLVCVALLAGFGFAFASWWGEAGGTWDTAGLGRQLVSEGRRLQELEARDRVVIRCLEGKDQVVKEVLAGRLTEAEAAEHFGRLEEARDKALGQPPQATGPEREARMYRCVRLWVEKQQGTHRRGIEARRSTPPGGGQVFPQGRAILQ
jgi:hypothetical protein